MEKGFFHSQRGYWQTITDPSNDIAATYPEGTLKVPLRPSPQHILIDGAWQGPSAAELEAEALAQQRQGMRLTFAQLLIGIVSEGWITEAEGDAWLAGTLPAAVLGLIGTMLEEQRFAAKARAARPSEVLRLDPLVAALGAAQGKTATDLDDFFTAYAQV